MSARGGGALFLDTILNAASWAAVLGATGAVLAAVDAAIEGKRHSFAAVRPPGHHALAARGMGFCLANNAVVAARHAQRVGRRRRPDRRLGRPPRQRHAGAGRDRRHRALRLPASASLVSGHRHGRRAGRGQRVQRSPGAGQAARAVRGRLWAAIVAATEGWTPDIVMISAGFDAMLGDPLGGFTLEPEHYAELTHRLRERLPAVPIVGLLEGGYVPERLADGVLAHLGALA